MQGNAQHTSLALARSRLLLGRRLATLLLLLAIGSGGHLLAAENLVVERAKAVASGLGAFKAGFGGHELVIDLCRMVSGWDCRTSHGARLTTGFSLMHWKAMVRSSVSRAVKAVDCLDAMVVFVGRSVRLWMEVSSQSGSGGGSVELCLP